MTNTSPSTAPIQDRSTQFLVLYFAAAIAFGIWDSWGEGWFITVIICAISVFVAAVILQVVLGVAGLFVRRPEND